MKKQLRIGLVVILSMTVLSLMAVVGTILMARIYPDARKYELVYPYFLTWFALMWCLKRPSWRSIWITGLGSPFLGAVWTLILRLGPGHEIQYPSGIENIFRGFGGGLIYAELFLLISAPVTFPVGVATAFLIRGVWKVVNESTLKQ